MENTFSKNMNALKKNSLTLHKRVEDFLKSGKKAKYTWVQSDNILHIETEEQLINLNHSKGNIANYIIENNINNMQLAIVLGLGFGAELEYLVSDLVPLYSIKYFVIIEKDIEVLIRVMEMYDISSLFNNPRMLFCVGESVEAVYVTFRRFIGDTDSKYLLKSMNFLTFTSSFQLNRDFYLKVTKSVREAAVGVMHSVGNDPWDSMIGINNMFENLDIILKSPGINLLKNKYKNKPAVIVSTGPSLNINKHLLHNIVGKAVIICPDASLKILLDMGIKPDIVVSLERIAGTRKFFTDLDAEIIKNTYFAATPVIPREIYDLYNGPDLIVFRDYDHFRWLEIDKGVLEIKSSSGNMAYKIADYIGADPIVLIGQDLAFAPSGETHATGMVLGEKIQEHYDRGVLKVKGNYVDELETSKIMYPFIKEYNIDVSKSLAKTINATEGGAFISGTELMTFQEAIDQYIISGEILTPITEVVNQNKSDFTMELTKIQERLKGAISDLNEVVEQMTIEKKYIKDTEPKFKYWSKTNIKDKEYHAFLRHVSEEKKRIIYLKTHSFQMLFGQVVQSYYINFHIQEQAIFGRIDRTLIDEVEWLRNYETFYSTIIELAQITIDELKRSHKLITKGE